MDEQISGSIDLGKGIQVRALRYGTPTGGGYVGELQFQAGRGAVLVGECGDLTFVGADGTTIHLVPPGALAK